MFDNPRRYLAMMAGVGLMAVGLSSIVFSAPPSNPVNTSPPVKVDFGREIRPIFSEFCYHCHGQDASSRKARLRWTTRITFSASSVRERSASCPVNRKRAKFSGAFERKTSQNACRPPSIKNHCRKHRLKRFAHGSNKGPPGVRTGRLNLYCSLTCRRLKTLAGPVMKSIISFCTI